MPTIEYTAHTTVDARKILDAWFDVERWSEWNEGVEWMELDAPMQAGTAARMKIPGLEALEMQFVWVDPEAGFEDATKVPGTELVVYVKHRVEQIDGTTKILYSARCEGEGAQEVLEQVTADFPQVIDSLIDWVK